ncbi:MAG: DNA-binding protein [Methylococcaceae bacterium]|nr:DNA-binding protein [Methylococcaceae bacterium]
MARVGITEIQVFEAAEALLQEGVSVTIAAVRERLGSGSYSTINGHLAKWREENQNRRPSDLPEIPPSIDNALRHVWALAWKEAQERIKTEREGLDADRREMEREKGLMEKEIVDLETQLTEQTEEMERVRGASTEKDETIARLNSDNRTVSIENARLGERAKAADERSAELRRELDKLHERLGELAATKPEASARPARRKSGNRDKKE